MSATCIVHLPTGENVVRCTKHANELKKLYNKQVKVTKLVVSQDCYACHCEKREKEFNNDK